MLTPEQVNAYAGLLAAPWDELNERILRDMVRRIVKAGGVTATAEWQSYRAQALGASKAYLIQQMNLIVQQIGPKEAAIFAQAMKQAYGIDVNDAAKAGRVLPTLGENEEARQIVQSGYRRTMNTLYNLTQTRALMGNLNMTETSQRQLAYYLDMAHADAISGAFSSDAAARRALNELAAKGLGAITYPSGHVDTLDVVVLRATRTGVNQTAGEITRYNADTLECDLMELDAHVGARTGNGGPNLTTHSWWQGQLVSRSGQHGYLSLSDIGYGDVRGFMAQTAPTTGVCTGKAPARAATPRSVWSGSTAPLFPTMERRSGGTRPPRCSVHRSARSGLISGRFLLPRKAARRMQKRPQRTSWQPLVQR